MGLVIDSRDLAKSISDTFARSIPASAYEVRLAPDGGLRWIENVGDETIVHETEPGTTFWSRLVMSLMAILPIEWLL
jgi:putative cardiolipin synthase